MTALHILHSEAAPGWGGQEIRVLQESRMLLERGHRVTLVCQPDSPLAARGREVRHPGFALAAVRMRGALDLPALLALRREIAARRPSVLHTHSSVDGWLVGFCGKLLGIPVVRSRHVAIPISHFFFKRLVYTHLAGRVIASGAAVKEVVDALPGMDPGKVAAIDPGVDMQRFDCRIPGDDARRELGVAPGQPLIGKIGVIRGWKGHDYFLGAVPQVLARYPEARFIIVGDGPGFAEIRNKVNSRGMAGAVQMLGHREDIPRLMAALDVMVLASVAGEASPQVIAQAFAMKKPVVGARAGGIPASLGNGEYGILAPPGDGAALAAGILELLDAPERARQLAEKAYEHCLQERTMDKMMDKTIAVYRAALAARQG